MGIWAKNVFGKECIGKVALVLAGTSSPEFEKEIISYFDEVIHFKDSVYHAYLLRKGQNTYPAVFNVYGASAMVDVLAELHDGGVSNVIFVGYAYGGFKNLDIGSYAISEKSYHFEGIYHPIKPDRLFDTPDVGLKDIMESVLKENNLDYAQGVNISVPAVTLQREHANQDYKKLNPTTLEMELSACFSRAKDLGIRAVGLLVISDNRKNGLAEKMIRRQVAKKKLLSVIIKNLEKFDIKPHAHINKFKINEYLAWVIEDPDDAANVYRE